jgi:PleD family two-component response regulator
MASSLAEQATLPPKEIEGKNGASPRGRILVVEDEATVAQLIVDVLQEEGHEAEAAFDSQDGLTRIARNRYDLVICDLRMPRLDGPAFYDALVNAGSPIQDCIVFITGTHWRLARWNFWNRTGCLISPSRFWWRN